MLDKIKNALNWTYLNLWVLPAGGAVVMFALLFFGSVGEGTDSDFTLFLGRFHPLILHLPIGALSVVVIQETLRLITKGKYSPEVAVPLAFAASSAVAAIAAGFLLGQDEGYGQELLDSHFWWGTAFGVVICLAWLMQLLKSQEGRSRLWGDSYWVCLGLSLVCMTLAGHEGASMTHGKTYLTDYAPNSLRAVMGIPPKKERKPKTTAVSGDVESPGVKLAATVMFTEHIIPIMEAKCYKCHNEDKDKGDFRMDQYDLLIKGGEEGAGLVAGDVEGSAIIERIELPMNDDYHMPPEGKPQVSTDELIILKEWIRSGASADVKVGELDLSEDVLGILSSTWQSAEE